MIVDFTEVASLFLINEGPDEPFGGGEPGTDFDAAAPATTGQVMKFVVRRDGSDAADTSVAPDRLPLPGLPRLGPASRTRKLSLNEMANERFDAPIAGMLGTLTAAGEPNPLPWSADEVLDRRPFDSSTARPPQLWEVGTKDTVLALPEEVTRLKARFDITGRFVWHCHIIDHEDNEMMRPYQVG